MNVAKTIASGRFRLGLCTSSPAVETASNPMKEKIDPAAAPMPASSKGANGSRFSAEKSVNPTTMNRARTASLMSTMIVFAVADSRTPRMISKPHSVTSTIAGRLKNPPSPGAALMAPGMRKPNRSKSSSLRYCPHRHGGGGDPVFEEQARRHAERHVLAHRRVGVGVRRAGDGNGRGELSVAHSGQGSRDPGEG